MDDATADEIGRRREEAERRRAKRDGKQPKKGKRDRVTVESTDDGGLITIVPTKGWRDREMAIGLLATPLIIGVTLAGTLGGLLPFAVALGFTVGLIALILATSPTTHLRWTRGGDCTIYRRSASRPLWTGRCSGIEIETMATQKKKKHIGYVRFGGRMLPYFPLTATDASALRDAARFAGMRGK